MMVSLVMFKADGSRRDFAMTKDRMIVGRTSGCDLRIPLTSVSRQHCELRVEEEKVYLRDLGSSNGTYHNSIRVQETMLKAGDEIVIGPVVFTLIIDGMPEQIDPVRTVVESKIESKPATGSNNAVEKPKQMRVQDSEFPPIEDETKSPTADLDDPLSALQALTSANSDDDTDSTRDALSVFEDEEDAKPEPPKKKK